ncbi:uncharacterized protein cubi_00136 [Cryptosporidium ubiquitum]|uniref:Uncharacterized protein n=1 Tax=Cryptosporidium ubiquitum TaxID=857276 RepID=A0A1J4MKM5_9CRYT|nr:uncharacterized protein cubi_00136 [Cryptosporidium ubiquitum]OII74583.1 hypothetical protein cubi_00136 [Cryptosporidium ubiquitum]
MEEVVDLIFSNNCGYELSELLLCVNKYLNGKKHNIKLLEKKLLIDYEIFAINNLEKIEYGSLRYEHEDGFNILRANNKKRIVGKYQELSLKTITKLFYIKNNGTVKLVLSNMSCLYLILRLLMLFISDGLRLLPSFEEDFENHVREVHSFIDTLLKTKEINNEIEPDKELISEVTYAQEFNALISGLIELTTSIFLSFQESTDNMLRIILDFFQSTKIITEKKSKDFQRELKKKLIESCMTLYSKSVIQYNIENLNLNINFVLSLAEEFIRHEDDYSIILTEILVTKQLFSIENLLYTFYLDNDSDNEKIIIKEEQYIRIGITIKFLHLTLKMIAESKKVLEKLIQREVLTNIIDYVILARILGVESSNEQAFESKLKNNKITSEYTKIRKNNIFKDKDGCYTKLMISNEGHSIEILQKLFIAFPILFSTSKKSTFKVVNHIHKILHLQDEIYDFSYFSLLFPVLCETCCTVYADKNMQLMLMNEILELFQAAANIMDSSLKKSEEHLSTYLSQNMEFLSIIHITSFTYLLLLDIHFLANQGSTKLHNSKGNLHAHACKAGTFLSSFLIWCSKYEENYILYYSAYCITSNIKGILGEGLLKSDGWIIESVKYLFFIMTQYCLSIGKSTELSYLESYQNLETSKIEKNEFLINFLRGSVLSNKQLYCFICASNIIDSLSEIQEDLVNSYFQSKIKEFNQLLSNIIGEVSDNKKIQCGYFVNFSHIKNIFMFLPFKVLTKMRKSIDLIFRNISLLISNFDLESKENLTTIPCVDLEIFLYNSVSSLYFILTIKSIFHYNIAQVENQLDSEQEGEVEEESNLENRSCFVFKLFNNEIEKINIYFTKVLEFYEKKKIYDYQYRESFSMFIIILEYMASIESKLSFSERKIQKHLKSFNQNNLTNFYKNINLNDNPYDNRSVRNENIPYHDILALIRFGMVNNSLNKHSFKYNDISSSLKSLRRFTFK